MKPNKKAALILTVFCFVSFIHNSYAADDTLPPVSARAVKLISRFEGFKPIVYMDPAEHPTIGYGHLITKGEDFTGKSLSEDEAFGILLTDIRTKADISTYIPAGLPETQRDALTSLCFNIGTGNFSKSTVLEKVKAGEIIAAYEYFGHWRRAGGSVVRGLIKRRFAELFIFADQTLDPEDNAVPSKQWGLEPMEITDANWGFLTTGLRREAVQIYETYTRD